MGPHAYVRFKRACERLGTPMAAALNRLVATWCDAVGEPRVAPEDIQRIREGSKERPASGIWEF